jgi:hypothetical protein
MQEVKKIVVVKTAVLIVVVERFRHSAMDSS